MKKLLFLILLASLSCSGKENQNKAVTRVTIEGDKFFINGIPTYKGRSWQGFPVEGLLPNSRMVQGIFDDLNPETAHLWAYPDTKTWDAGRNTREFLDAMPEWKKYGLLAFTINLQGGSPFGYSKSQPWHNSAIREDGTLRDDYMERLGKILDKADDLGMVVILGIFYFGQDERLTDEKSVISAVDNTLEWLFEKGYRNVLIEICNETMVRAYNHDILKPDRVHELILRVREKEKKGYTYPISTSYGGGTIPGDKVLEASDFVLLHGNGVKDPASITGMVEAVRKSEGYHYQPILFNEDDHFDFDKLVNNFTAATKAYASWGYFDYRMEGEVFTDGYQSVPVDWSISSDRKRGFFNKIKEIFID